MIINQQNLADLFVGFQAAFNQGFNDATVDWQQIATPIPSSTREQHYAWLGQFPQLREWIGERVLKDMAAHDYRVKNKKFESTVKVSRDDIDDDQFGIYKPLFEAMGYAAKQHPDELVFGLLAAGLGSKCYDGQYFFDTDHPVGENDVQSVSNLQTGSGNPWFLLDTSRPLKPLIFQKRRDYALRMVTNLDDSQVFMSDEYVYGVDARVNAGFGFWQQAFASQATLSQANFEAARAAMRAVKSDEGRPLGIRPTLLVVGPSNEAAANETIKVQRQSGGADNPNYNAVQVLVTSLLD